MILVTGATGTTGSEVVRRLLERGRRVRAMSRRETTVHGLDTVPADFDDPASLAGALDGVRAVYLVTAPPRPVLDHDAALIAAATAAGVEHVVKLGAISGTEPGTWHARAERPVRDSGLDWTILRPGTFASNLIPYAPMVATGGPLPNPTGTGAVGVIDPRDIAAVAVEALTGRGHSGRTYTLTGPRLLTFPQQVAELGQVLGTTIAVEDVPPARLDAMLRGNGMDPDSAAEAAAGMARSAEGRYAVLTDTVSSLLGRAPIDFRTWARDHRHLFG